MILTGEHILIIRSGLRTLLRIHFMSMTIFIFYNIFRIKVFEYYLQNWFDLYRVIQYLRQCQPCASRSTSCLCPMRYHYKSSISRSYITISYLSIILFDQSLYL